MIKVHIGQNSIFINTMDNGNTPGRMSSVSVGVIQMQQ